MNYDEISKALSSGGYIAKAVYYEEADALEYVRFDIPSVYRRIDETLTLVLSMDSREPIGFKLKGFRNFYFKHFRAKRNSADQQFLRAVEVLEKAMTAQGDKMFAGARAPAYQQAIEIAHLDGVLLDELPRVA